MATEFSECECKYVCQCYGPINADTKVDVLAEIINDLLTDLVNDGRMTRSEERVWRAATYAAVVGRPELSEPGAIIVAEAESILFAERRGRD